MAGPALLQLLADLRAVDDPSPYEAALRSELEAVETFLGALGGQTARHTDQDELSVISNIGLSTKKRLPPLWNEAMIAPGGIQGLPAVPTFEVESAWRAELIVGGGSGSDPGDLKRLRCDKSDCQNKRM